MEPDLLHREIIFSPRMRRGGALILVALLLCMAGNVAVSAIVLIGPVAGIGVVLGAASLWFCGSRLSDWTVVALLVVGIVAMFLLLPRSGAPHDRLALARAGFPIKLSGLVSLLWQGRRMIPRLWRGERADGRPEEVR